MKFIHIYVFIVVLSIFFYGCKSNLSENKMGNKENANTVLSQTPEPTKTPDTDSYVSDNRDEGIQEEVIIKALYEKPLSLKDENTVFLEGLAEGEEYIEMTVRGEIFDFEQVKLEWDENDIKEKETVRKIEKLKDQTIVIKTYQPEGIPVEKIKWKSRSGKTYEYIISEKSLGDSDNSITNIEMTR
jgi:hypothetical protein